MYYGCAPFLLDITKTRLGLKAKRNKKMPPHHQCYLVMLSHGVNLKHGPSHWYLERRQESVDSNPCDWLRLGMAMRVQEAL